VAKRLVFIVLLAAGVSVAVLINRQADPAKGESAASIESSCLEMDPGRLPAHEQSIIEMHDYSSWLGKAIKSKTFALAVADIDDNHLDDILVGAHDSNPILYLNTGTSFLNRSNVLFPRPQKTDLHGYTFVDLDNDNDLDLAIGGGGSDGVGKGAPNIFLWNQSSKETLRFSQLEIPSEVALPRSRSRAFIPVASKDGTAVDLYLTTLLSERFPNRLFQNTGSGESIAFIADDRSFLTRSIKDHGRGVIADLDNDGRNDYLTVDGRSARLYWNPESERPTSMLASQAYSVKVADFTNDGQLDIFVGRSARPSQSDLVSYNNDQFMLSCGTGRRIRTWFHLARNPNLSGSISCSMSKRPQRWA